jgi:hypothetical protein
MRTFRGNPGAVFAFSLGACLLGQFAGYDVKAAQATGQMTLSGTAYLAMLAEFVLMFMAWSYSTALVAQVVEGGRTDFSALTARLSGRWFTLFIATLRFVFFFMLGLMALVVPGILYYFRRAFYGSVIVFEGTDSSGVAMTRSRSLIGKLGAGRADKVFLVSLVFGILSWALLAGVKAVLPANISGYVAAFGQAAIFPLTPIAIAFLYVDARIRDEGYDLELRSRTKPAAAA